MNKIFCWLLLLLLPACIGASETSIQDNNLQETPELVRYWMGTFEPISNESISVSCETYITPYNSTIATSTDPAENLENSLNLLLTTSSQSGQRNVWADDLNLVIESVSVEDGFASVQLSGMMMMRGICADIEMGEQLVMTIFSADARIEQALVLLNNANIAYFFNKTEEMADRNFVYTREDIPQNPETP